MDFISSYYLTPSLKHSMVDVKLVKFGYEWLETFRLQRLGKEISKLALRLDKKQFEQPLQYLNPHKVAVNF